jgi:hypothetical protein
MKWITLNALLVCDHELGQVVNAPTQTWVTISNIPVLVENDPESKPILKCPNVGTTIKPCTLTLKATAGYSNWIRIEGRRVCLDTITGFTDGTPPGMIKYKIRSPGQDFVSEAV